jgi:hypothetical protein
MRTVVENRGGWLSKSVALEGSFIPIGGRVQSFPGLILFRNPGGDNSEP